MFNITSLFAFFHPQPIMRLIAERKVTVLSMRIALFFSSFRHRQSGRLFSMRKRKNPLLGLSPFLLPSLLALMPKPSFRPLALLTYIKFRCRSGDDLWSFLFPFSTWPNVKSFCHFDSEANFLPFPYLYHYILNSLFQNI